MDFSSRPQQPPAKTAAVGSSHRRELANMLGHPGGGASYTPEDEDDGYELERTALATLIDIDEATDMGSRGWPSAASQFDMMPQTSYDMHQQFPPIGGMVSPGQTRTPQPVPSQQQAQQQRSHPGSPSRTTTRPSTHDRVLPAAVVERNDYREAASFIRMCKGDNEVAALDFLRGVFLVMTAADPTSAISLENHNWDRGVHNGPPYLTPEDQAAAQVQLVINQQNSILHQAQRLGITPKPPPIEPPALYRDEIDERVSTLVILVPGRAHIIGHLIGKGGAEVGKIEHERGVTIKIEPASKMGLPLAERSVCIIGQVASVTLAQQLVSYKVHEKLLTEGVQAEVLKMVVPNEIVRHLIGKSGSNINRLQNESGARIQVEPESTMMQGSVGRTIVLQGAERCRTFAQYLILRQIAEDRNVHAEWANRIHSSPVSPATGANAIGGQSPHHNPSSMAFNGGNAFLQPSGQAPMSSPTLPRQARPVATATGPFGAHGGEQAEVAMLTVPEQAVALLIGRNGSSVIDIQNQTGARVNIARPQQGQALEDGRRVTVSGTPKAVAAAQNLIRARVQAALSAVTQQQPHASMNSIAGRGVGDIHVQQYQQQLPHTTFSGSSVGNDLGSSFYG